MRAFLLVADAAVTRMDVAVTEVIVAAFDADGAAFDEGVGKFFAGAVVDGLDGGAGDLHIGAAFFLGKVLAVDEADGFELVDGQNDGIVAGGLIGWIKCHGVWQLTDSPAFFWTCHGWFTFIQKYLILTLLPL